MTDKNKIFKEYLFKNQDENLIESWILKNYFEGGKIEKMRSYYLNRIISENKNYVCFMKIA